MIMRNKSQSKKGMLFLIIFLVLICVVLIQSGITSKILWWDSGDTPTYGSGDYGDEFYVSMPVSPIEESPPVEAPEELAPLSLDIILFELPSIGPGEVFYFSFILTFNRDSPTFIILEEKIRKGKKIIWSEEKELEIKESMIINEKIEGLKAGDYQLELIGHYGNETSKLVEDFSIEKRIGYVSRFFIFLRNPFNILPF